MGRKCSLITNKMQIHVPLMNEGTDVLLPTTGYFVEPDVARIEAMSDYKPEIEDWVFPPGSEVRCVAEFREGKQILVARSRTLHSSRNW